jgi:hypothetical protein
MPGNEASQTFLTIEYSLCTLHTGDAATPKSKSIIANTSFPLQKEKSVKSKKDLQSFSPAYHFIG